MKKKEIFTLSLLTFFMGMVLGFLISPAKQGFGNTVNNYYDNKHVTSDES